MQSGEAEREHARAFAPPGTGDLLLPEVEEAAGKRGRVVIIAHAFRLAHGTSIAHAAAPSLTCSALRTMLRP